MKKLLYLVCATGVFFGACNNNSRTKQETETGAAEKAGINTPMDSAAMMKAWMDYMTPGEMHKMMASWNGTWNEEITFWMGPDAPPEHHTAVAENMMILNGLYQESVHSGDMNGMPFEGRSTLAYNKINNLFESTWIDNMGSGIMYIRGGWDSVAHSITMSGKMTEPMSGEDIEIREVVTIIDDSTQLMEMYNRQHGEEFKSMEIKLKRKKATDRDAR